MKAANTLRRSDAPTDDRSPIGRGILSLEERITRIEQVLGLAGKEPQDIETWLYTAESIAEYRHAIRRAALFNDMKSLERYTKKTGGRVPRLGDSSGEARKSGRSA